MTRIAVTDEQISAAQAGDDGAMWDVVSACDPLIRSIIRSVAPGATAEDAEDYLQESRVLLIQHIRSFDSSSQSDSPSKRLTSYVYQGVRRMVAESAVVNSTPLTIDSTQALRVRFALWEAGGDMEAAWLTFRDADSPTKRMSRTAYIAMVEALADAERLDAPVSGDDGESGGSTTLADTLPEPDGGVAVTAQRRDYARWLLTQLSARQSYALRAFYGIQMTTVSDAEVAAHLGIKVGSVRETRRVGINSARRVDTLRRWSDAQATPDVPELAA